MKEIVVDSFAGGGGASLGIALAVGRAPDVAINHDAAAIAMHAANHPATDHYTEDVFAAAPRKVTGGRPVGLLWASPDCRHHSRAKGSKPVEKRIRGLAWAVVKWAVEAAPRVAILENVREFEDWGPVVPRWVCRGCGWKGTEGQAKLARRRKRACPRCESTALAETADLIPCPDRKGLTFKKFVGRLKNLGYHVEWRVLNAADYGAPTHRRRLFLVARNDGRPVVWPAPTHGDPKKVAGATLFDAPLKPWRTAAECIDWSIPCPSIFDRKKPLVEKTLRRIALGVKRFVLDNPRPFLVDMQQANRSRGTDEPLGTVTTQDNRFNLVQSFMVPVKTWGGGGNEPRPLDEPTRTVTASKRGEYGVVAPVIAHLAHGDDSRTGVRASDIKAPIGTVHAGGGNFAVVAPTLYPRNGERPGQSPRCGTVEAPLPTVVQTANGAQLVSAFLAKHFGGVVGVPADTPLPTTTARGTQTQVVAANLVHMNHGDKTCSGADEPARTVTAGGFHAALVYSFLTKYFGSAVGSAVDGPAPTATGKDRFGLVTVTIAGQPYVIVDIGMRMLKPRELARAQGFPGDYVLTGTATSQVERIGNSVAPPVAAALVRANYSPRVARIAQAVRDHFRTTTTTEPKKGKRK